MATDANVVLIGDDYDDYICADLSLTPENEMNCMECGFSYDSDSLGSMVSVKAYFYHNNNTFYRFTITIIISMLMLILIFHPYNIMILVTKPILISF